jgi:hypothetical protein
MFPKRTSEAHQRMRQRHVLGLGTRERWMLGRSSSLDALVGGSNCAGKQNPEPMTFSTIHTYSGSENIRTRLRSLQSRMTSS